jgi:hypothetical protein
MDRFSERVRTLFRPASYCAFAVSVGLISYGALVATVLSPALIGSAEERLAYMATHGGSVASLYILFIIMALAEVPVMLGLIALTIKRRLRCVIFGGIFALLNIAVRMVGYMTLIATLSGMVSGFVSVEDFTFWDNLGYMIEGGGFFLMTVASGLFGWALMKGIGLERVAGVILFVQAFTTFVGGMLRIGSFVTINFPTILQNVGIALVGPTMGVLCVVVYILLGLVFLSKAREAA